jgi:hypothetical protein
MFKVGDLVSIQTGKIRVVTGVHPGKTPEEYAAATTRFEEGQSIVQPTMTTIYDTRVLRNGKPYGPVRRYAEHRLSAI